MKRVILPILLMLLPILTSAEIIESHIGYDAQIDGIYYKLNSSDMTASLSYEFQIIEQEVHNGGISQSTYYKNHYSGDVVIPNIVTYEGNTYTVTSIGDHAFCVSENLKSVTIPNSVTSIGKGAFYNCSSLAFVTIPSSVKSLGYGVFDSCSSITSIDIPQSVTSIPYYAFQGCSSLTSINIPNSVTYIDNNAFEGCI